MQAAGPGRAGGKGRQDPPDGRGAGGERDMTPGHPSLPRRRLALLGAALLGAAVRPGAAAAEPFPDRPIRMVIAGPAGAGAIDLVPRLIADPMAEALGQ